jgi:succinoglycan biosynthesis protein ExoM
MTDERLIAICVATCGRPETLLRLVVSLAGLEVPAGYRLDLRIVNNLPETPIPQAVHAALGRFPGTYRLLAEPERNIALVRNRAVDLGPAALVAFVDDDEIVEPNWLCDLVEALAGLSAAAVFGPVERVLPVEAPRWLRRGRFLEDGPRDQDLSWNMARTGNALVSGEWFYEHGLRFDPDFGRSGGEDAHLFGRIQALGGRLVSTDNARVHESYSPARARFRWLWLRAWNCGEIYERLCRVFPVRRHPATRFFGRLARSMVFAVLGLLLLLIGRPEGFVRSLLVVALAIGGAREWLRPRDPRTIPAYGTG